VALRKLKAVLLAGATTVGLVAVAIPGSAATVRHASGVNWSTVTTLTKSGPTSMAALVAAAKKEGHLNVIALPNNWANYGRSSRPSRSSTTSRSTRRTRWFQPGRAQRDQVRRWTFRRPGRD